MGKNISRCSFSGLAETLRMLVEHGSSPGKSREEREMVISPSSTQDVGVLLRLLILPPSVSMLPRGQLIAISSAWMAAIFAVGT
jgi:hypothetical protein